MSPRHTQRQLHMKDWRVVAAVFRRKYSRNCRCGSGARTCSARGSVGSGRALLSAHQPSTRTRRGCVRMRCIVHSGRRDRPRLGGGKAENPWVQMNARCSFAGVSGRRAAQVQRRTDSATGRRAPGKQHGMPEAQRASVAPLMTALISAGNLRGEDLAQRVQSLPQRAHAASTLRAADAYVGKSV